MLSVMCGSSIFSMVLAIGDRSDMGLLNVPIDESLFGLGIGMVFDVFQMLGMVLVFSDVLYICVRSVSALWPRCFKCFMFMLSGPVELLFRAFCIACLVCSMVISMGVVFRRLVFLSMCLLSAHVWCSTIFVNCLLNACAFCLLVMAVCVLKVIVVFGVCGGFLLFSPAMVFQSVCEFVLWSQSFSRCCFHMFVLCCCMSLSMLAFMIGICGSRWLVCLVLFLCSMRSLMFCGRSLCLLCIFPLGMWCLSAVRMMFVSMLFAVCMLSVQLMSCSAVSIS